MKSKIEEYNKKTIFSELKDYCYFADEHDYIEITEWKNCEGFDIEISGKQQQLFRLTRGEYDLIKKLIKILDK